MRIKILLPLFIILSATVCLPVSTAFAQMSQVRYEIPLRNPQDAAYKPIALGNRGLFLYSLFFGPESNSLEVIRIDTAFNNVWKGFIPVQKSLYVIDAKEFNDFVHILLKDRFNPHAEFVVLSVNLSNGNYTTRLVKTLLAFQPTTFDVTKTAILIGGYFNYRPLVLYASLSTGQSRILPGFFNDVGELDQVRTDENGNIDIVVSNKSLRRRKTLWIRSYDATGDLSKTILLQDEEKNLIYGRAVSQPGGNLIVAGAYGRYADYSRGIFVANIDPYGEYTIKYYNYGDLEHFFSYMKAKHERRVKERIERRKIRGKKIKFNYRLMVDELIQYDDNHFLMLGEAFYPHYSYASSRTNGFYGGFRPLGATSMYGRNNEIVFDGYQYTHAVVIGFDQNGNLQWDNSFEINDVRTMNLEQFVKIHPDKDKISLLYLFDNVIRSKVIKDNQILEGKSYDQIHTGLEDDVVRERDTQQTKLEYWYGDTFYASGIQVIRKRGDKKEDNIRRRVFFINKIIYK